MNIFQKAIIFAACKATGFPIWRGSTQDMPPGGWGALDWSGVGSSSAINLATVYGCCRVLCQTLGSVPWNVYREDKSGTRTKATDHWLYPILHDSPNAYMTSMEFREALVMGYCLRGNGYAEKASLGKRVVGLNPLRPDWMVPRWTLGGQLVFDYHGPNGKLTTYQPGDLVHLKNFSIDGILGLSPIAVHSIEHARYTEAYSTNFMRNQGRPSGVVESPRKAPTDPGFIDKWRADWQKLFSGDNAGGTAILWDEATYKAISITPEDAQYIETRKLNASDIAGAIYGVPLNMLGHTDKTATYASAEQFDVQFVKHTVRPLAVRLEQAINKSLLASEPGVFCEMDLDGLQRGDSKTQAEYFATLVTHGIMVRNEARRKLNLPEIDYADKLTIQANMVDLDKLADLSAAATPALVQGDIRKSLENHVHVTTPMAEEQLSRVVKEITTAAAASKRKHIQLVKAADGTTLGATVTEE